MTIKNFRNEFKNERNTVKNMIKNGSASFQLIYKSTEQLRKLLKSVKDGKTKNNIKYEICNYESKMIEMLENMEVA